MTSRTPVRRIVWAGHTAGPPAPRFTPRGSGGFRAKLRDRALDPIPWALAIALLLFFARPIDRAVTAWFVAAEEPTWND